jgi:hypothetical protein
VKHLGSKITGVLSQVEARSKSAGDEHGRTGLEKLPIVSESEARSWLLAQGSPQRADEALARSLISTFGVTVQVERETRYPLDRPSYSVVVRSYFQGPSESLKNIPAARARIEAAMTPATSRQTEEWLTMLQAATASRAGSAAFAAVTYELYAATLRKYPADVARAACEKLARGTPGVRPTWFPTLGEIIDECDHLVAPRKAMSEAQVRRPAPQALNYRAEPSAAEKETVAAMVAAYRRRDDEQRAARPGPSLPPPTPVPVDEHGLSASMRAWQARNGRGREI